MLQTKTRIASGRPRYGSSSLSRITVYPTFAQGIATKKAVRAWRRKGIAGWPVSTLNTLPEAYAPNNKSTPATRSIVTEIGENDSSLNTIGAVGIWPDCDDSVDFEGS